MRKLFGDGKSLVFLGGVGSSLIKLRLFIRDLLLRILSKI